MNRGSARPDGLVAIHGLASMRPRFMNRGSVRPELRKSADFFASMRPRFMNRGSSGEVKCNDGTLSGFNEAPIHESGK